MGSFRDKVQAHILALNQAESKLNAVENEVCTELLVVLHYKMRYALSC